MEDCIFNKFRDDWLPPDLLNLQIMDDLFSCGFLDWIVIKDSRAVLGTHICPLTVPASRIVDGEEHFQQLAEADQLWVKGHLNGLSMPGFACANSFIGRVCNSPTGIA